ncbi:MAG: ABC transporter ATP-binding protein [Aeromonadaceae bacterium]
MPLLCEALTLGYDATPVLSQFSLTLPRGQLTVLLGANGCGKSTLLKALAGQIPPQSGAILFEQRPLSSWPAAERARRLAYLPQYPELFADLSVFDLVRYGRYPHQAVLRQWQVEDEQAVQRALSQTGLLALSGRPLSSLSGGQQQRAWIAMVLAQEADVLLLDEPINHLDLNHQVEIMDLLIDLRLQGKTLVVVLHDLNLASRYADQLVLLHQGRILQQGSACEVLQAAAIEQAYGQPVAVVADPIFGTPWVIPQGRHRPHSGL